MFTTRPDTLFGATYMVLAPEHPLVDGIVANEWPDATRRSSGAASSALDVLAGGGRRGRTASSRRRRRELERQAEGKEKTGVFTGAFAINPINGERIPIFIADYVLMGYGTGAIMAVPGHDERDFEFAEEFDLPISVRTRAAGRDDVRRARRTWATGRAINTAFLDGLPSTRRRQQIIEWLEETGDGAGRINYKLRDWLFSRQRYWGEPFPIVYDENGLPVALPESMLPSSCRRSATSSPASSPTTTRACPSRRWRAPSDWVDGRGSTSATGTKTYLRETNTMPQWAGSCWYYLRYLDPDNENAIVDPEVERYWMRRPRRAVSTSTSAAPSTRCCTCCIARFWHKVLFDLGHVSTPEPFAPAVQPGVSPRTSTSTSGGCTSQRRRSRSATAATSSRGSR